LNIATHIACHNNQSFAFNSLVSCISSAVLEASIELQLKAFAALVGWRSGKGESQIIIHNARNKIIASIGIATIIATALIHIVCSYLSSAGFVASLATVAAGKWSKLVFAAP
jgi:hypothetical protein